MNDSLATFAQTVRVTDGAWGTELQKLGLDPGVSPELWNTENPSAILAVATSYARAGSDVILTNTFGANRFVLAPQGVGDQAAELAEIGTAISRRAAGDDVKVFASMGPTGKIVMMGDVPPEEILAAFADQAAALARGGADAIVLETFNELAEIKLAMQAVGEACDLPVIASMTFASGPDGTRTMMGDSPADLAAAAEAAGANAVGANCGAGPDNYTVVAALFQGFLQHVKNSHLPPPSVPAPPTGLGLSGRVAVRIFPCWTDTETAVRGRVVSIQKQRPVPCRHP